MSNDLFDEGNRPFARRFVVSAARRHQLRSAEWTPLYAPSLPKMPWSVPVSGTRDVTVSPGRFLRLLLWVVGFFPALEVRQGVSRFVILTPTRAYKFAKCHNGLTAFLRAWVDNRSERLSWHAALELYVPNGTEEALPVELLCPVLRSWALGLLIVMPRCELVDRDDAHAFAERHAGDYAPYTSDLHPGNFGVLDGRIVCVDYAD